MTPMLTRLLHALVVVARERNPDHPTTVPLRPGLDLVPRPSAKDLQALVVLRVLRFDAVENVYMLTEEGVRRVRD